MLSVLIPARSEPHLEKTIDDLFAKAEGEIEVLVTLDGDATTVADRPGLRVFTNPTPRGARWCLNRMVEEAQGPLLLKTDAHCAFSPGFDAVLLAQQEPGSVTTLRRYSLDPETWRPFKRPIDYEYLGYPIWEGCPLGGLHAKPLPGRDDAPLLDETQTYNGAVWCVRKEDFQRWGGLDERLWSFHIEGGELGMKAWLSGGRLLVQKGAWHAHWWKSTKKRTVPLDWRALRNTQAYYTWYWTHNQWPLAIRPFSWLVEHFWPVPDWPADWEARLAAIPEPALQAYVY